MSFDFDVNKAHLVTSKPIRSLVILGSFSGPGVMQEDPVVTWHRPPLNVFTPRLDRVALCRGHLRNVTMGSISLIETSGADISKAGS